MFPEKIPGFSERPSPTSDFFEMLDTRLRKTLETVSTPILYSRNKSSGKVRTELGL